MTLRMRFGWLGILGLLFIVPVRTNATVVQKVGLEELVEHSAVILNGMVRTVDEDLSTSCKGPFLTRVDLEVFKYWKGSSKPTLELILPGGRACSLRMKIPGMPQFEPGQEVILFLEKTPKGYALTGLSQGVYWVEQLSGARKHVRTNNSVSPVSFSQFDLILNKLVPVER